MPSEPFAHVIAAIATPFRGDLSVDFGRMIAHAIWLFETGCDGLVLFGTTGEAASLTAGERKAILEHLVKAGIDAEKIVVGTGCCAVADTVELTKHASAIGCAGALVLPPFFYKGLSDEGIIRYFDRVIAECGSSLSALYLYHIPQTAGAGVSPDVVAALVARHGGKIRGYKDSSGNWSNTAAILSRFPQLDVYVGSETLLSENLRAGGAGCISASVNVQPGTVRRVYDGWNTREGEALQNAATGARKSLEQTGALIAAVKTIVGDIHREPEWATVRPPLDPLPQKAHADLLAKLRSYDLEGLQ